jgi:hypothetical protein
MAGDAESSGGAPNGLTPQTGDRKGFVGGGGCAVALFQTQTATKAQSRQILATRTLNMNTHSKSTNHRCDIRSLIKPSTRIHLSRSRPPESRSLDFAAQNPPIRYFRQDRND